MTAGRLSDRGARRAAVLMVAVLAVLAVLAGVLSGCAATPEAGSDSGSDATPRELTSEEAERLAVVRFHNWDRGFVPFDLSTVSGEFHISMTGTIDFRNHSGYASVVTAEEDGHSLLQWTPQSAAAVRVAGPELPADPPQGDWQVRALAPSESVLDAALSLVLSLAADRPENPVLLAQNGARWVGTETISGEEVDVFTGPGSDGKPSDRVTYYVDEDGHLLRCVARIGADETAVLVNFSADEAEAFTLIPELASGS